MPSVNTVRRIRIVVVACAVIGSLWYMGVRHWVNDEPHVDIYSKLTAVPECECNAPEDITGILSYEGFDALIGPRDATGMYVTRSLGPCVRVRGSFYRESKGGARIRLPSGVVISIVSRDFASQELTADDSDVVVEGCLFREWYPPFPVYQGGMFGESRRRALVRNHLQARPVGYVYSIDHCRIINETAD